MISTIVSIIKAISALDNLFQLVMVAYTQSQIASMRAENREAIKRSIAEHDQREAERVIGNPNPGEASGEEGTQIVDAPPPNIS